MHDSHETQLNAVLSMPQSATASAQEQWDETLDALAVAVSREVAAKGLLRKGAAKIVRFHFRGYARRLLVPILDETQREIRKGYEDTKYLCDENSRLRAALDGMRNARRHEVRAAAVGAALFASLVTAALVLTFG